MAMTDKQVDDLCERLRVAFGVPTQADVVKIMVDRFLCWKLPESFYPDAGITFDRHNAYEGPHWPIGTNLLTAEQATEMVRHMLRVSNAEITGYRPKERKMFAWLRRIFDRSADPVYSCDLYRDKDAGSCAHVDGPLCDFPKCSMLAEYRQQKEGMTINDDPQFREDLRKMMAEQRGKSGPVPHA